MESQAPTAVSIQEALDRMKPNTRWYALYWASTGEQHPQEHHYITGLLAKFRKQWSALDPVTQFQVLDDELSNHPL